MWQGLVTNALEQNFFRPHTSPGREMLLFIPILQIRKLSLRKVGPCSKTQSVSDLSQNLPFSLIYHFSEEKVCTLSIDGAGFY